MRTRSPRTHTAPAVLATLTALAALAGCSDEAAQETGAEPTEAAGQGVTSSSSPPLPPVAPITPTDAPPPSPPVPAGPLIDSASWGDSDYGVTLRIAPSDAGRAATGPEDPHTAWREVLELAPDADTPGMWEQFECHWTWARVIEPDKPTWNVEPWRPVVDEGQMIAEGCNPGGPEV